MNRTLLKSIFRNLWRNRVTSAINILGLTLGLSSCLFLYINLKYESTFDSQQPKADRIYRVNITKEFLNNNTQRIGNTSSLLTRVIRNDFPEFESVFQVVGPVSTLVTTHAGTPKEQVFEEERNIILADSFFLDNMKYDFIAGNPKTALNAPNSIILSQEMVEKYYPEYVGKEMNLLGMQMRMFDSLLVNVTGIIETPPSNTNFTFKILASNEVYFKANPGEKSWGWIQQTVTMVVLKPNQSPEDFTARLKGLSAKYEAEELKNLKAIDYSLLNLTKLHYTDDWGFVGNYNITPEIFISFLVVGLFILLTACINFINLQTAQSVNRAREVGIRKVLGGSKKQLIFQFLLETAILTTISLLFAIWITEFLLDGWNDLLSIVHMNLQLDLSVILAGLVLVVLVTLLAGTYPALKLSSFKPIDSLKGNASLVLKKKRTVSLRQVLVVTQFVISQVLIIGTIVITFQMDYFLEKDLGFATEAMLHLESYEPDENQIKRLVSGLEAIPDINSFSISSGPPMSGNYNTRVIETGFEDKGNIDSEYKFIDHRFIDHFELELLAGRNFRPDEFDYIKGFIVNETMLKYLEVSSPQDAIGKMLNAYGNKRAIIGVVKDFHNRSLNYPIKPVIMFSAPAKMNSIDLKVTGGNVGEVMTKIKPLYKEVFPKRTFDFKTIDDYILKFYTMEKIMLQSVKLFAIVAIIIGCLGLYGLVAFMAIQKTKEIGIRKVLGASYHQILVIFTRKFVLMIILAFVIAAPLAYVAMDSWLNTYPYRIALDWKIFAIGFGGTLLLTLITVSYVSLKAAATNPADTLQYE